MAEARYFKNLSCTECSSLVKRIVPIQNTGNVYGERWYCENEQCKLKGKELEKVYIPTTLGRIGPVLAWLYSLTSNNDK